MTDKQKASGRCLCGAVEVSVEMDKADVGACHCEMCRRWSSGPLMAVTCENVTFKGEDNIARFRSSEWAERGFCKQCGTNLFYHIVGSNEYQLSVGLLDDPSDTTMTVQLFTDSKPSFYGLANKTKEMTAADVYAAVAPPPE